MKGCCPIDDWSFYGAVPLLFTFTSIIIVSKKDETKAFCLIKQIGWERFWGVFSLSQRG